MASSRASEGSDSPAVDPRPARAVAGGQRGWWLEDAVPGGVLLHPGGRTVDEAEHVWLAWLTHNSSDVHGNADVASRGAFGTQVVLGALSVAVVVGLAGPATGSPEVGTAGWSDGWHSIRLGQPVFPGDTLSARSLVHGVSPVAGATGRVRRTIEGRNQRGEVVVTIEEEREVPARHQG